MKKSLLRPYLHACFLALVGALVISSRATAVGVAAPATAQDLTIPADHLLQPAEVAQLLHSPEGKKPLILQVGSSVLYAEAHIPGAEYAGPAGEDTGLQVIRDRVRNLGHDQFIVIYCGCCPWNKCPNIRRAYHELASLGFTHVKAMYVADDFGTDWVAKGYPVAKGR